MLITHFSNCVLVLKFTLAASSPNQFLKCAHINFFLLQLVLFVSIPIYAVKIYTFDLDSNHSFHLLGPMKYSDVHILKSCQAWSYIRNYLNVNVKEFCSDFFLKIGKQCRCTQRRPQPVCVDSFLFYYELIAESANPK